MVANIDVIDNIRVRRGVIRPGTFAHIQISIVCGDVSAPGAFLFSRIALIANTAGADLHPVFNGIVFNSSDLHVHVKLA